MYLKLLLEGTDSVLELFFIIGPKALKSGSEMQNVEKGCFDYRNFFLYDA